MENAEPQQIGMDVTGLSDKQIKQLEDAKEAEGFIQNGIMFPQDFKSMQSPDEKVVRLKNTKRNKDIWGKYQQKGFLKDGSFNYKTWSENDLIREISKKKDEGKKKTRTNFLRFLGTPKLIKIKEKLALSRLREETKSSIANSINKFLLTGTPEAEAKYKRKLKKIKAEKAEKRTQKRKVNIEKWEKANPKIDLEM